VTILSLSSHGKNHLIQVNCMSTMYLEESDYAERDQMIMSMIRVENVSKIYGKGENEVKA